MSSLFSELRRRNVFKVGIAYVVLGWLVVQVTETVVPVLKLPDFTLSLVIWLGIVGFPFALLRKKGRAGDAEPLLEMLEADVSRWSPLHMANTLWFQAMLRTLGGKLPFVWRRSAIRASPGS